MRNSKWHQLQGELAVLDQLSNKERRTPAEEARMKEITDHLMQTCGDIAPEDEAKIMASAEARMAR